MADAPAVARLSPRQRVALRRQFVGLMRKHSTEDVAVAVALEPEAAEAARRFDGGASDDATYETLVSAILRAENEGLI